jgi:hypothetical protein
MERRGMVAWLNSREQRRTLMNRHGAHGSDAAIEEANA